MFGRCESYRHDFNNDSWLLDLGQWPVEQSCQTNEDGRLDDEVNDWIGGIVDSWVQALKDTACGGALTTVNIAMAAVATAIAVVVIVITLDMITDAMRGQ